MAATKLSAPIGIHLMQIDQSRRFACYYAIQAFIGLATPVCSRTNSRTHSLDVIALTAVS
jgi:hypothetical protein